jgi:hypothetical protein
MKTELKKTDHLNHSMFILNLMVLNIDLVIFYLMMKDKMISELRVKYRDDKLEAP